MPITIRQDGGGQRAPLSAYAPAADIDTFSAPVDTGDVSADDEGGMGLGSLAVGGAAGLLALLASRNPGRAGQVAKSVGGKLNELRYGSMLSGFAVPKSAMGNIGAAVTASLENRTAAPLKEFFSPQTFRDWVGAVKAGNTVGPAAGNAQSAVRQGSSWLNAPGRIIGAGDTATRNALVRGLERNAQAQGHTVTPEMLEQFEDEAKRLLLQRELPPEVADMADSAVGRFMIPFRTTPFNTLREGLDTLKFKHPAITAGAAGAGAAVGASTEDPKVMALTAPLAATYALPYLLGGVAGKYYLKGDSAGKAGRVASGISPYSDYAIGEMITNPARPYTKPAALSALDYLFGGG
jgi:hypothetical protein